MLAPAMRLSNSAGYGIMQTLIARGVIGDFPAPDILRFDLTPLYITMMAIVAAVDVIDTRGWYAPEYRKQGLMT